MFKWLLYFFQFQVKMWDLGSNQAIQVTQDFRFNILLRTCVTHVFKQFRPPHTVEKRSNSMLFIVAACSLQFRGYSFTKYYLIGLKRHLQIPQQVCNKSMYPANKNNYKTNYMALVNMFLN